MTDSENRYGDAPLGKSVEEVEGDAGNLVNSPVPGENLGDDGAAFVPAIPASNASNVIGVVGAGGLAGNGLVQGGGDADDGTTRENRDSSEGTV